MTCPVDHSPLVHHEKAGPEIRACRQCCGLWMSRKAIQAVISHLSPTAAASTVAQSPVRHHLTETKRLCPDCSGMFLEKRFFRSVTVDTCPGCNGVWFDGGELDAIIQWHRTSKPKGAAPSLGRVGSINKAKNTESNSLSSAILDTCLMAPEVAYEAGAAVFHFVGEIFSGLIP